MNDYILLMHNDGPPVGLDAWAPYFAKLRQAGAFQGGSAIGDGFCVSKSQLAPDVTRHLAGYIRVRAEDLRAARELVTGNPAFETGGTVEIRELPRDS